MQSESKRNLFKFLAVRPVQTAPVEDTDLNFLRPPAEILRSELAKALENAKDWKEAQANAKRYLETSGYPGAWGSSDPAVAFLRSMFAVMQLSAASGDLEVVKKFWKANQAQARNLKLAGVRTRLWETLLAAYCTPRIRGMDRGVIISCLKSLQWIDRIDTTAGIEALVKLLRATPLLPVWLSRSKKEGSKTERREAPEKTASQEINAARRQIVGIDEVLDDIDAAERRRRLERTQPPRAAVTAAEGRVQNLAVVSDTGDSKGGMDRVAGELKPSTVSYLDANHVGWRLKSTEELTASVNARRSDVVDGLDAKGGRGATAGVRARTEPEIRASPDIEVKPIAVSPGGNFEKTIAGSVGTVRPLGIGDLLIAEEVLLGYEEGEISYIENVMATERRERTHRQLDRVSNTTMSAVETTSETERDLQSEQRNEVAAEVQNTVQNDLAISTGVNVSGGFGPVVEVDTSADFAVSTSSETSTSNSTSFVQDVIDNTVSRLSQSMREQIRQQTLTETEEINRHGFENKGSSHVVGIYRWLEKVYQVQVVNYGKRLMMEFVIPEPSAFYKYGRDNKAVSGVTLEPPVPLPEDFSFEELTPSGYVKWVDRYRVPNVSPPPTLSITVGKVLEVPETMHDPKESDYVLTTKSDSIDVPEGYRAKETWVRGAWVSYPDQNPNKQISNTKLVVVVGQHPVNKMNGEDYKALNDEERLVPVGVVAYNIAAYTINVEIRCERKDSTLAAWQMETYKKVVDSYSAQLSAYNAQLESKRTAQTSAVAVLSPDAKRGIEQRELKRGCLELLTGQYFHDFDSTVDAAEPFGYPEFRIKEAMEEKIYSGFFEECMEWEQMTYAFYPYYWGRKSQWVANSMESDGEPIFESFLRAGSSRVLLPVKPGWEKAVLYYLDTGEIWNGGEVPVLDEELAASISLEAGTMIDLSPSNGRPVGKPWTYTLPTTLVKLQADATLPTWPPRWR
jgi:hypothetical protein